MFFLYAIVCYVVWFLIVSIPFYFLDKATYSVAKFLNEILNFEAAGIDLRIGVVPTTRVLINIAKMLVVWFTAGLTIKEEAHINIFVFTTIFIIGIVVRKMTVPYIVESQAKKYVAKKLQERQPFSEREFLSVKAVDLCQKWNFKTKGKVTFNYVKDVLQEHLQNELSMMLKALSSAQERIFLYKEFEIFVPYLEEKGLQMNIFLPEDTVTVSDAGFCKTEIYNVQKENARNTVNAIQRMIFSLDEAYQSYKDTPEMLSSLPTHIVVTDEEKYMIFQPIVKNELDAMVKEHLVEPKMPTKEDGPALYSKIQPGLVNEDGIYTEEPKFEGEGCNDCGVHTMPEDDDEDELE